MRILHVIAQKPDFTGSGIYLKHLIKEASALGHENWLIAGVSCRDTLDEALSDALEGHSLVVFETEALPFSVVGMSDEMPYKSTCYAHMTQEMVDNWVDAFDQAMSEATLFNPEKIIVHHLWGLVPLVMKHFKGVPCTVISHGTEIRQMELLHTFHAFRNYANAIIESCQQVQDVVALNTIQKNEITRLYGIDPECIRIVGVGYNPSLFYPPKLCIKEPIQVIYAGKISHAKGVMELIHAFNALDDAHVELNLIGSADNAALDTFHLNANQSNIKFVGALSQRALSEKMRKSHVFILPSYFEGASLVTLEALAAGMRVIVSDLPSIRAWVPEEAVQLGRIHFVSLPKLVSNCEPCKEEIPAYVERLKEALVFEIKNSRRDFEQTTVVTAHQNQIYNVLKASYAWEAIFKRVIHSVI